MTTITETPQGWYLLTLRSRKQKHPVVLTHITVSETYILLLISYLPHTHTHTHTHRALMTKLITPLQGKVEEWKKTTSLLDKEHEKGTLLNATAFVSLGRVGMLRDMPITHLFSVGIVSHLSWGMSYNRSIWELYTLAKQGVHKAIVTISIMQTGKRKTHISMRPHTVIMLYLNVVLALPVHTYSGRYVVTAT